MVIAVVIAFMPFVTDNAYAASRYGTKEARITQNEKMYKKAAAMSSSTRAKYLNVSLSDMYETDYAGMSKAEQKSGNLLKDFLKKRGIRKMIWKK